MGRILPTTGETTPRRREEPTVVCLDDERAEDVLAAVQSGTARAIFRALLAEPRTPTAVASAVDTSVENVGYHLDNLSAAGLVEVVDTAYSEKGREMDVYGASEDPVVLLFGSAEDDQALRSALSDLVPVVGPVAVLVALKEVLSSPLDVLDAI